jgi:hypothetical protein
MSFLFASVENTRAFWYFFLGYDYIGSCRFIFFKGVSVAFSYGVGPVIGGLFVEHSTWYLTPFAIRPFLMTFPHDQAMDILAYSAVNGGVCGGRVLLYAFKNGRRRLETVCRLEILSAYPEEFLGSLGVSISLGLYSFYWPRRSLWLVLL